MYRQYEDPRKLERELAKAREEYEAAMARGEEDDGYWAERIGGLEERVNFAWQDEEYDESMRDPADEEWLEENSRAYMDDVYSAESVEGDTSVEGEPVKAGKLYDLIKKALGLFDKLLDKLDDFGEVGERKGGEFMLDFLMSSAENAKSLGDDPSKWPESDTVLTKIKFVSGEDGKSDVIDVLIKVADKPDSSGFAKKNVVVEYSDPTDKNKCLEELMDVVGKIVDDVAGTKLFTDRSALDVANIETIKCAPVKSSIKVTLQKIVADDEIDIELTAIDTPYDVPETVDVLNRLTEDADFVESLPTNEPASYDIDPDELSVIAMDNEEMCPDISCSIFKMLESLYRLYTDSMYIVWNAKGSNYTSVAACADSYVWTTKGLIDQLSAYHYQLFNYAPHPAVFIHPEDATYCMEAPNEVACLQNDLQNVVDVIDLYCCNFDNGLLIDCLLKAKSMFEQEIGYTLERFNG